MVVSSKKVIRMMERDVKREAEKKSRREAAAIREEEKKTKRNILNCKCGFNSAQEEIEERYWVGGEALKVYKKYLPDILKDLSEIKDPRNPKKVGHKMSMLMLYGILIFVFHISSRREANREMTRIFMENIKEFFPELDSLPHADALARLLEKVDAKEIEEVAIKLIKRLIRDKKLEKYKVGNRYIIVIDGTQKFSREWEWCENCLKRHVKGKPEGVNQYYAYALEASIVLPSGLTIPFMTEFLDRYEHKDEGHDNEKQKQDCELKAFIRLAERLKKNFPQLGIAVTLDGLYAKGPVMEICKACGWDFMIVLKDGSLKTVWENIEGIKKKGQVDTHETPVVNGLKQKFWWVNGIDYTYGENSSKSIKINVVVCEETWTEIERNTGQEFQKSRKFSWLSFKEINTRNVEKRCNCIGRPRWNIETQNLVEKHHGYSYEHCFSYDWNAMKGFHYLMHLGHIINVLTLYSAALITKVREKGARGTVKLLWKIFSGSVLDFYRLNSAIQERYQVRLAV